MMFLPRYFDSEPDFRSDASPACRRQIDEVRELRIGNEINLVQ